VRELRNALERASILCEGGLITEEHLSLPRGTPPLPTSAPTADLKVIEQQTIAEVLQQVGGNKAEAARRLGLSRTQLYGRLRKYHVEL
jgi:DNA-binding NtrC family response regulator